jgi:hypothetical protein
MGGFIIVRPSTPVSRRRGTIAIRSVVRRTSFSSRKLVTDTATRNRRRDLTRRAIRKKARITVTVHFI